MARLARNFSVAAAITALLQTIIFPFIFGGLSIIFATLSKGKTKAYQLNAKIAIIISVITLICNTAFTGVAYYLIFYSPTYKEYLNTTWETVYGMSWDEYCEEYFPYMTN